MRTLGYQILITLMWLTVPVATFYLARDDHEKYMRAGVAQRADCEARAQLILRYTDSYSDQAAQLRQADTNMAYHLWDFQWQSIQMTQQMEQNILRLTTPTHYPRTDELLNQAEALLDEQQEQVEIASTRREQYVRAEDGLESIRQSLSEVEAAAQYYKRIHAEGIYLMLMEDMAKLEDRFRQLQQHRRQLNDDTSDALLKADESSRGVQRELKHLDEKLSQDEQTSYYEALRLRLKRFDPWTELRSSLNITISN